MLNNAAPTRYSPRPLPAAPEADWIINGQRWHETGRERTETGETVTLEPVDADPGLGYAALRTEEP